MSDKCIDDQLDAGESVIVSGGKVWKPPSPSQSKYETCFFAFISGLLIIALFLIFYNSLSGVRRSDYTNSLIANHQEYEEYFVDWAKKEYGYSEVKTDSKDFQAHITTTSGEEKEIGYIEHKGLPVLYENSEQLAERLAAIDAGTYSEELVAAYQKMIENHKEIAGSK